MKLRRGYLLPCLVSALLLTSALAQAADFRIRLLRQEGNKIFIYHDAARGAADGELAITLGPTPCLPVAGDVLKPGRGGDSLTTLIVIDRGGTIKSGMGQYSQPILNAVKAFLANVVGKGPGDKVAIADTSGRDSSPATLHPTDKIEEVNNFLANLTPPTGSGADIYGVANAGLAELDKSGSRLGAVIVISDGVDPAIERDDKAIDNHKLFIAGAAKRGVPVATIFVDRSAEKKNDNDTKLRNGRARLNELADQTNGEFDSLAADGQLETRLKQSLDGLGKKFAMVARTACTLCGKLEAKVGAPVAINIKKDGASITRSLSLPQPRIDIAGDDYRACDEPAAASGTDAVVVVGKACKNDQDCDNASKCAEGHCTHRKTAKDLVPYIAGGLLLLALLFGFLAWRRSQRRQQTANAEREAGLQRQIADADAARQRAEQERNSALALAGAPTGRDPALDQLLNPDLIRLQSAPGSAEQAIFSLKAGVFVIGAGNDADLRLQTSTVSTHHAQLQVEKSGVVRILDLGSSNGTFVNQVRIAPRQPVELRVGDVLGLSSGVQLQVFAAESANSAPNNRRNSGGRTVLGE